MGTRAKSGGGQGSDFLKNPFRNALGLVVCFSGWQEENGVISEDGHDYVEEEI